MMAAMRSSMICALMVLHIVFGVCSSTESGRYYYANVTENQANIGDVVYDANVNGRSYLAAFARSSINAVFDVYFSIDNNVVTVKLDIDREGIITALGNRGYFEPLVLEVVLFLQDQENDVLFIRVLDENDEMPVFESGNDTASFLEETMEEEPLGTAQDFDEGENSVRFYSLADDMDGLFALRIGHRNDDPSNDINRLELYNTRPIDREQIGSFTLELIAAEGAADATSVRRYINVEISDDNCDNSPMFAMSRFHPPPVPENSTVDFVVFRNVTAYDLDVSDAGRLTYHIEEVCTREREGDPCSKVTVDQQHPFELDTERGFLVLSGQLDREQYELYEVSIHATDGCNTHDTATVVVTVADVNDNCPEIDFHPTLSGSLIRESNDIMGRTVVAGIIVIEDDDRGANGEFTQELYELIDGIRSPSTVFELVQTDLNLQVRQVLPIDRESKSEYTLELVARDRGSPPCENSLTFTLTVVDSNDNPPIIQRDGIQPVYEVREQIQNLLIETIQATDADDESAGNGEVSYVLPEANSDYPYQDFFIIEPTGMLKTGPNLDREILEHLFVLVVVHDNPRLDTSLNRRDPVLNDSIIINVTLIDINDNYPIIHGPLSVIEFPEDFEPNSLLFRVNATDRDTPTHANLQYTLTSSSLFSIVSETGEVNLGSEGLDFETSTQHTLTITASDGVKSDTEILVLQVGNLNDEHPVMDTEVITAYVKEDRVQTRIFVANINATDPDGDVGGPLVYRIVSGNELGRFEIDDSTGRIETTTALDQEELDYYLLIVNVYDGIRFSLNPTRVNVHVLDINDNPPVFEEDVYNDFRVLEGSQRDTIVLRADPSTVLRATDEDSGNNSIILYRIAASTPDGALGWFTIDEDTAVIRTTRSINREDPIFNQDPDNSVVSLTVQARNPPREDGVQLEDFVVVRIEILDVNDEPPEFATDSVIFNVPENHPLGRDFGEPVLAIDRDLPPNNEIVYEIKPLPPAIVEEFTIDSETGQLTLRKALNFEAENSTNFTVIARDPARPDFTDEITVIINVTNTADTCLRFENFGDRMIPENSPLGHNVIEFRAVTIEGHSVTTIEYTLTNNDGTISEEFDIVEREDQYVAIHTITDQIDREALVANGDPHFSLNITAHDVESSEECEVLIGEIKIEITDINDNPPAFGADLYNFEISENVVPRSLGFAIANDPDEGRNSIIVYSILGDFPFMITEAGEIWSTEQLNREPPGQPMYSFTVTATDSGDEPRSDTAMVHVRVLDVNDNDPVFDPTQNRTFLVPEDTRVGADLEIYIIANDIDEGSNGEVTLSGSNSHFQVLSDGELVLLMPLDREADGGDEYSFDVTATDDGERSVTARVDIIVTDVNDNAPEFDPPNIDYSYTIPEDKGHDPPFAYFSATDSDAGDNSKVMFALEDVSLDRIFCLEPYTGEMSVCEDKASECERESDDTVLRLLDFERENSYRFNVVAYNPTSPTLITRQEVSVTISNVNEHRAEFDREDLSVVVDEGISTEVLRIQAYDMDADSTLTYSVEELNGEPSADFSYQGGVLSTTTPLNHRSSPHMVVLRAHELSTPYDSETLITVIVRKINGQSPSFEVNEIYKTDTTISESTPVNTVVHTVHAVIDNNNDTHDAISYEIAGGNVNNSFRIDSLTGDIIVQSALDYDSVQTYTLSIRANDTMYPQFTSTAEFVIRILNVNDEYPMYTEDVYEFGYIENSAVKTVVGSVVANDRDLSPYGTVKYSLLGGPNEYFEIDSTSGQVKSLVQLDRENSEIEQVEFTVLASDSGVPPKTATTQVIVRILDSNDNPLQFTNYQFVAYETDELSAGQTVLHLADYVTDPDESANSIPTFEIVRQITGDLLAVSPSGEVSLREDLPDNPEIIEKLYEAEVRVFDPNYVANESPNSAIRDTAIIRLAIEGLDDRQPRFEPAYGFSVSMQEGIPMMENLFGISGFADDPDMGDNGELRFQFQEVYPQFSIDPDSGNISVVSSLDYEQDQVIVLRVAATDMGQPSRTAETTLTVNVLNINDNIPVFTDIPETLVLSPVPDADIELFTATAHDNDLGPDGILAFSLTENGAESNNFSINVESGTVRSRRALTDGERFNIVLIATDKGSPSPERSSTTMIIVIQTPDRPPAFGESSPHIIPFPEESNTRAVHPYNTEPTAEFRLVYSDSPEGLFTLSRTDGTLELTRKLDYLSRTEHNLYIEAYTEDTNDPNSIVRSSTYLAVQIQVIDVNNKYPRLTQPTLAQLISEDALPGTLVFTAQAFDEDTGEFGKITYDIFKGNGDQAFTINGTSGEITLIGTLDREVKSYYNLQVRARDGASLPKEDVITVRIEVTDVNDFVPRFQTDDGNFSVNVLEYPHTRGGDAIIRVTAIDEDVGVLDYRITIVEAKYKTGGFVTNPQQNSFTINQNSGLVSVGSSTQLDYENINYYLIRVGVDDRDHFVSTYLKVHILDVNDHAPEIRSPLDNEDEIEVWEDQPVGTVIAKIESDDEDEGINSVVTYSLGEGWEILASDAFVIDPHSGFIRTKRRFIYTPGTPFHVTVSVMATDQGSPPLSSSLSFDVLLKDVNNHPPVFSSQSYLFAVPKTSMLGDHVGSFHVSEEMDISQNSAIHVEIQSYYREASSRFRIDGVTDNRNIIRTHQELEVKNYTFRLQARNFQHTPVCAHYNQVSYSEVTVVVYPPCPELPMSTYSYTVAENVYPQQLDVFLATSSVSRPVDYFFYDNSQTLFNIDRVTGELTLAQALDRESEELLNKDYYAIPIVVSDDPFQPLCITNITVFVLDENDNSPSFISNSSRFKVEENKEDLTQIGGVTAMDPDSGDYGRVRYYLSDVSTVPFRVDEIEGAIYPTRMFDAESDERSYIFEIIARDLGDPPQSNSFTVNVSIIDINEFLPQFVTATIPPVGPDKQQGDVIFVIVVNDDDVTINPTFEFVNEEPKKYFELREKTGEVILSVSSDMSTLAKRSIQKRQSTDISDDYFTVKATIRVSDGMHTIEQEMEFSLHNSFSLEPIPPIDLMLIIIIVVVSSVVAVIVVFLLVVIIACVCRRKRISKKAQIKVSATPSNMELERFHSRRSQGSRSSTPGQHRQTGNTYISGHNTLHHSSGSGSSSRQSYSNYADDELDSPNEGMARSAYHSPGLSRKPQNHSSHARSTSDLASSVGTDMLGSQQLPHPKAKIAAIYAAHHGLLNNHGSQESIHSNHTFASEGGGEADAEADINNMLYNKYEFEDDDDDDDVTTLPDDSSYIGGKDRQSLTDSTGNLNIPPVEEEMRHYPYSQPVNEWVPRAMPMEHAITELSELASYSSSQEQHVPMPTYDHYGGGASSQGSRISLLRHPGQVSSHRQHHPYSHDVPMHRPDEYDHSFYNTPPQDHRQRGHRYGSATGLSMSQEYGHPPREMMHNRREPVDPRMHRGQQPRFMHFSQDVPPTYHSQGHHFMHRGTNIQTPSTDTPTEGTVTPHRAMGQDYDQGGYMSSSSTSLGSTNLSGTTSSIGAGRNIYRQ